eukprot:1719589-Lingulodinium_polyedra.AAC.1
MSGGTTVHGARSSVFAVSLYSLVGLARPAPRVRGQTVWCARRQSLALVRSVCRVQVAYVRHASVRSR